MSSDYLRINIEAIYNDFRLHIETVAEEIANEMADEMKNSMRMSLAKKEKIDIFRDALKAEIINATIETRGFAIVDSFGTGERYDMGDQRYSSLFNLYKSSGLFNPLRTGKTIVGRVSGSYKGVIDGTSLGRVAGQPIFGKGVVASLAIQKTEARYFNSVINRKLSSAISFFFSTVIKENIGRYFSYEVL